MHGSSNSLYFALNEIKMKEFSTCHFYKILNFSGVLSKSLLLIALIAESVLVSCTGKDDFTTGNNFIEARTKLAVLDTFKVDLSTVLVDSIATSATGIAFAGNYHDNFFGSVKTVGYFEPGYKSFNIDDTEIFDSAAIALVYSGYSYGDTTSLMSLNVYQLDEQMTLNDNTYLYNTSEFDYSHKRIGSKIFYPEPTSSDTLFIPVNSFGKQIFEMYRAQDADVSSSELFLRYVKGFVIKSDSGNSVIGFKADETQTLLRIYFHVNDQIVNESSISIPFGAVARQFNSVSTDFAGSELTDIKPGNVEISSDQTADRAFLQGMVGLLPKIRFPSLQDITLESRWRILKAELVFEPVIQSYNLFSLPDQLCLYNTDKYNKVGKVLKDDQSAVIYSKLVTDDLFNADTRYTFDITSFINDKLADGYFNVEDGLFISLPESDLNKTFDRLIIESKNPSVKLRLYYLTY
jgi:hypothetical protein